MKLIYFMFWLLGIGIYFDVAKELMISRGGFYIGGEIVLIFLPLFVKAVVSVFGGKKK